MRSKSSSRSSAEPIYATPRSSNRRTRGVQVGRVARTLGQPFMEWQQQVADVAGELLPDGSPAFRETITTLMRQQGKTTLVLSHKVERCTLRPTSQRVAYTAQTGMDARKKVLDDEVPILQNSKLWPLVRRVARAQGSEGVIWRNGSRIDVLASSASAGHGRIIDLGVIDEAFDDIDDRREQALLPAMITRPDAQLLVVSTMGTDASVYLNRKVEAGRAAALEGRTSGIAYFEWAIPEDEDIDDPAVWWRFMPAMGVTISEAAVAHARTTMSDGEFRRAFGNQRTRSAERVIPEASWRAVCRPQARPEDPLTLAVEVSPDRDWAAIVACGPGVDGVPVLELVDYRPSVGWVHARAAQLRADHHGRVVVEKGSPAAALQIAGVEELSTADAVRASGALFDAVIDATVLVRSDARMDAALAAATKQPAGEAWRFGRKAGRDAAPIVAASLALWGLRQPAAVAPVPGYYAGYDDEVEEL